MAKVRDKPGSRKAINEERKCGLSVATAIITAGIVSVSTAIRA